MYVLADSCKWRENTTLLAIIYTVLQSSHGTICLILGRNMKVQSFESVLGKTARKINIMFVYKIFLEKPRNSQYADLRQTRDRVFTPKKLKGRTEIYINASMTTDSIFS